MTKCYRRLLALSLATCFLIGFLVPTSWAGDDSDEGGVVETIIDIVVDSISVIIEPTGNEDENDSGSGGG
ncbi:MAG: hypothetical protein AAGC60_11220 [Acidobacteriota bacterium]